MQKMSAKLIQIYPANLATFEESTIFGASFRRVWAPMAPKRDMMLYEIVRPSLFSAQRIFYVKRATSEGGGKGGGLHVLTWNRTQIFNMIYVKVRNFVE